MKSNNEVRECITKFDHDLSLKCNKSALLSIQHELGKTFLQKETDLPEILERIDDVNKWYQKIENKRDQEIESYKERMDEKISDAMDL